MNYSNTNRITTFYPNVKFHDSKYLGDGPYNTLYQVCDYCIQYKKIYILNKPVYYKKGTKRKLVSYCSDCNSAVNKGGCVVVADDKYFGYYEILDAIRDNGEEERGAISFEEAVKRAFNRTENVSYNGSGAEPGVSMLKRYLGYHFHKDSNIPFNSKRLWEFRYKLQYEEPRVKVVKSSSDGDNTLLLTWNKEHNEESTQWEGSSEFN